MILGNPWGLLALLAVPAIVALHLFRRRFRPRPVTALFLWGAPPPTAASGRTWQRLVARGSLVAELLAALALTWWLSDPHLADRERAEHLVLVLDARRTLQAAGEDGVSAEQRARDAADALLAALDRDDRATLVMSGAPPRLLAGPGARPTAAREALRAWRADAPWHPLDEALALAIGLGGAGARTVVVSDRVPARLPAPVGVVAVGTPLPTSGLADVRWLRDAEGERIAVRVLAQGGAPRERDLALTDARGALLARRTVALAPDEPRAVVLAVPAGLAEDAELGVALLGPDPIAADDRAQLRRPARRGVRIAVDLPEAEAKPWRKALAAVPDAALVGPRDPAHLLVTTDPAPPAAGTWRLRAAVGAAPAAVGPFLARAGDPLLADLDCTGVLWSGGGAPSDEEPLLLAGDHALLSGRRSGRDRLFTLACDLSRSTLTRHTAWPCLLANLVAARRAALPGLADPNLALGLPARLALPPGRDEAVLHSPDGTVATLRADADGVVLLPGLRATGLHEVAIDGRPWLALAVNDLDPRGADLADAITGGRPAQRAGEADVERGRGLLAHLLPLIAVGAAAIAAWACFRREEGA